MNALTRDLIKLVDMTEEMMKAKEQKEGAPYREAASDASCWLDQRSERAVSVEWNLSRILSVFPVQC